MSDVVDFLKLLNPQSKLNFNMNASFITIPNSGSTSSVTMSLDKNYDITNEAFILKLSFDLLKTSDE